MAQKTFLLLLALGLVGSGSVGSSAAASPRLQGSVVGQILDGDSGDPLVGVRVFVTETGAGAQTGIDGSFVVENLSAGRYQILFEHSCSYPVSVAVTVPEDSEDDPIFLRFSLPLEHDARLGDGCYHIHPLDPEPAR